MKDFHGLQGKLTTLNFHKLNGCVRRWSWGWKAILRINFLSLEKFRRLTPSSSTPGSWLTLSSSSRAPKKCSNLICETFKTVFEAHNNVQLNNIDSIKPPHSDFDSRCCVHSHFSHLTQLTSVRISLRHCRCSARVMKLFSFIQFSLLYTIFFLLRDCRGERKTAWKDEEKNKFIFILKVEKREKWKGWKERWDENKNVKNWLTEI